MDFTLKSYRQILLTIKECKIPVFTVEQWIRKQPAKGILLRHDVDRFPANALKMAILENHNQIRSSYYFRHIKSVFKEKIIRQIASLDHEIGYHYEDLAAARGDWGRATQRFVANLDQFRRLVPVKTVAMHGSPLSKLNNLDLWNSMNYEDVHLLGDASIIPGRRQIIYFTDTGRSWANNSVNLRDRITASLSVPVKTSTDLIQYIQENSTQKIYISCHPERWNNNPIKWILYFMFDLLSNTMKRVIRIFR